MRAKNLKWMRLSPDDALRHRELPPAAGFEVQGRFGVLKAWPDGGEQGEVHEPTYWVDSTFQDSTGQPVHQRQRGFRLSTVWCMCACICLGEQAIDLPLLQQVSDQFEGVNTPSQPYHP